MSVSYEKSLSMVQTSCGLAVWGSPHSVRKVKLDSRGTVL